MAAKPMLNDIKLVSQMLSVDGNRIKIPQVNFKILLMGRQNVRYKKERIQYFPF